MLRLPRTFTAAAALACFLSAGCADKAEPDLERCEELEEEKEYEQAIEACELAHSKDPESTAGKNAKAKIPVLERAQRKEAKKKAEKVDKQAKTVRKAKREKEAELAKLKADMQAREKLMAELDKQLAGAANEAEIARLRAEIAKLNEAKKSSGPKPPACTTGDPMCGL